MQPPVPWEWAGAEPYKNERLAFYQRELMKLGVNDPEDLRLLTAHLLQENGRLEAEVYGDNGCSLGIPQYNTCAHHRQIAKKFLTANPDWGSWEFQMKWMAGWMVEKINRYPSLRLAIISHNCPSCAAQGGDSPAGYYAGVERIAREKIAAKPS